MLGGLVGHRTDGLMKLLIALYERLAKLYQAVVGEQAAIDSPALIVDWRIPTWGSHEVH